MQSGVDVYTPAYRDGWQPDPRMSVSEWADAYRILAESGGASERYKTGTTPYARAIMDALSPWSPYNKVVAMWGTQTGKTTIGTNWLGSIIDMWPAPTLVLRPTDAEAKRYSRQRLDSMIDNTPRLAAKVVPARVRDGGRTRMIKEFPGGLLFLSGANTTTGVKSVPVRNIFGDEIDEYPMNVNDQGHPVDLAENRTHGPNFPRRKIYLASTPTVKGLSRIEAEYNDTDQCHYFVPCPHCGHFDWLRWENMHIDKDDDGQPMPETAHMVCIECGCVIEERHKRTMLPDGQWRPTAECNDPTVIGFQLSSLYSPLGWLPWSSIASDFFKAQDEPDTKLRTWINSILAETYEERFESVEPAGLLERVEEYAAEVPDGVGILVASADVQGDRIECQVKGYGAMEESWLITHQVFHGDPHLDPVWFELDEFLQSTFTHQSGQRVPISCTAVDSGYLADRVYQFCKARLNRRVFAVRGGAETGKPLVGKWSTRNVHRARVSTLCVDTGKEAVYSRLKIQSHGPGFCHLPIWTDEEYVAQLTAEVFTYKWRPNRGTVRVWSKTRERNEALDLEVYALAALYILGPALVRSLPERANALSQPVLDLDTADTAHAPALPRPRGWVGRWRG